MKLSIIIAGLLLAAGTAFAVSEVTQSQNKTYSWRYKMTVEVETPEGPKSGSAVREVTVWFEPRNNPDPRDPQYNVGKKMKGEAVVVDLGERGKVFGTLSSEDQFLPFRVFDGPPGLTIEGAEYYSALKDARAILTPTYYPTLVTFTNIDDPLSVELLIEKQQENGWPLKYTIKADHFSKYFGDGVSLKNITVEMTDEAVTKGILHTLEWIPNFFDRGRLDGSRFGDANAKNRLANKLSSGSFTTFREY